MNSGGLIQALKLINRKTFQRKSVQQVRGISSNFYYNTNQAYIGNMQLRNQTKNCKSIMMLQQLRSISTSYKVLAAEPAREKCMNVIHLMGRVGREPERRGSDEKPCQVFSLATNTYLKETDGVVEGDITYQQRTDWHRIVVFKPLLLAQVEKNLTRGARVMVTGRIVYDSFHDTSGVRHKTTSILADNIYFLSPGKTEHLEDADM